MKLIYAIPFGIVMSWLISFAIGLLPPSVTLKPILGVLDSIKFFLLLAFLVGLARKWLRGDHTHKIPQRRQFKLRREAFQTVIFFLERVSAL